jgi:hypothetical protein
MALNSSGPLSLGGATTGQSINLELGVSATALASINSASFRTLAGVASGAISISNFYGKSNTTYYFILAVGGGTNPSSYFGVQIFDVDSSDNYYIPMGTSTARTSACIKISKTGSTALGATYQNSTNLAGPTQMCVANNRVVMPTVTVNGNYNDLQVQFMTSGGTGSFLGSPTKYRWTGGGGSYTQIYTGNYTNVGKDSSGNAYITGICFSLTDIFVCCSPDVQVNNTCMLLVKINTSNGVDYIKGINQVSYNGFDRPSTPLIRSDGLIVLSGSIPNGSAPAPGIMLFNPSTNAISWKNLISFGANFGNYDTGYGTTQACIDGSDNVYLNGTSAKLNVANTNGTAVSKFNSSGTVQWATMYYVNSTSTTVAAYGIACDSAGNVYSMGTRNLGSAIQTHIVKLNSSGTVQWQLRLFTSGTANTPNGRQIKILSDGSIAVYYAVYQSNAGEAIITLPADGSKTGTFTVNGIPVTVEVGTLTVVSASITSPAMGNTGSYSSSFSNPSYGTATTGSATVTSYVTTI